MSSINSIILPFINKLLFTFFPGKEEKDKRVKKLAEKIEKLFSSFTTNKSTIGYIILTIHWIGLLFVYWMALFGKINIFTIIILAFIFIIPVFVNLYYGGLRHYGCILTRLERYFFNDHEWRGPLVCMQLCLNLSKSSTTQFYSEIIGIFISILLATFIVYKIYYKMKFGEDIDTYNIISNKIKKMI